MAPLTPLRAVERAIKSVQSSKVDHPELGIQERVVCYELYHQLRLIEEKGSTFLPACVQAELNKTAQHRLRETMRLLCKLDGHALDWTVKEAMPDLLIHQPGTDKHNRLVLEAKVTHAGQSAIMWDLAKLALFRAESLHYQEAVFLLLSGYGEDPKETLRSVEKLNTSDGPSIQVISFDVSTGRFARGVMRFALSTALALFKEAARKRDSDKRRNARQLRQI